MRVERLQSLVARLHALPRRRLTLMVGVDGRAAAGKTTFTRALGALDPGLDVIEMLDFALPAAERLGEGVEPAGRAAAGVDWRRLRSSVLLPLSRDQIARYQRYDAATDAMAEWRIVPVGGIVIVEGRYSCVKALATFYDFRVWVECPFEIRRSRLVSEKGSGSLMDCDWLSAEEAYIKAQNPAASAHLVVDGSGATAHDTAAEYVRVR
ncbi:MAG TPA: uridine kinase [Candidatus Dormibacteraeota bacterium]|nr:uridine kinase [Candidatus Dormibacteraeota bacterium]